MVKETFRLDTVPRESHILGLSGTVPYLATSLSTVFLAWNLNKDVPSGNRILDHILLEHETAKYLLDFIEPLQLGYGAVIISFLGAIHWVRAFFPPALSFFTNLRLETTNTLIISRASNTQKRSRSMTAPVSATEWASPPPSSPGPRS